MLIAALLAATATPASPQVAADPAQSAPAQTSASAPAAARAERRLPEDRTTHHRIALADRSLAFSATAGAITLRDRRDRPEADIAFVAYTRDSNDPVARPVTFAVNGGPGAASAYLHIAAIGPWRLPMAAEDIVPSGPVDLVGNAETWLDFTDLVFIDPVGTGFSRLVEPDDRLRNRYLSIDGDIEALAEAIRLWLRENGRIGSPKYFVGESYGGFRGPLLAEALESDQGIALSGMTLASPVLDFGWWQQPEHTPLPRVSLLPSLAAASMEARDAFDEAALQAVEDYAVGDYVSDLLRGLEDDVAVARIVERVSTLTGLDRAVVQSANGRIGAGQFAREILRDAGLVLSLYDATVADPDPFPEDRSARAADPVLDGLTAPLTGAMLEHYRETLDWLPERRYQLLNRGVSRAWDWGGGRGQPEAVSALRRVLALDPEFDVLVVHGYADLVTPYFASDMILDQLPAAAADQVRRATDRGGHMFYLRAGSRRSFRSDAAALYGERTG
jgi:carboxypeptidase C (cathepsin A)